MKFAAIIKEASSTLANRCCRYDRLGAGEPRLDDMQRRWVEVWGASHARN